MVSRRATASHALLVMAPCLRGADNRERRVEDFNHRCCQPPLPAKELEHVLKAGRRTIAFKDATLVKWLGLTGDEVDLLKGEGLLSRPAERPRLRQRRERRELLKQLWVSASLQEMTERLAACALPANPKTVDLLYETGEESRSRGRTMELIHGYIQLDIAAADPRACATADQDDLPKDLERALNAVENIRAQIKRGCGSKRAKPERVESASSTGLLDAEKAAERLGVPKSWVMREKNAGRLPFVYVGRWVRFRPSDIDSIIANGTEPR